MIHSGKNGDNQRFAVVESVSNLTGESFRDIRKLYVFTGFTTIVHKGTKSIIGDVYKGVVFARYIGDMSVVGGRDDILTLLASENIHSSEVALSMSVLTSLRGGHINNFARLSLDDDVSIDKKLVLRYDMW